jgi:hypothetical protein
MGKSKMAAARAKASKTQSETEVDRIASPEVDSKAPEVDRTASPAKEDEEVKILVDQMEEPESEMSQEFVCKICLVHVVGCRPKLTNCSHLFCGDCIKDWFSMHRGNLSWAGRIKSAGTVPCPMCKEPLHGESDLHAISPDGQGGSLQLWKMLAATKVRCANHPKCRPGGQCDWVGDYGSYQEHARTCTNTRCAPVPAVPEVPIATLEVEDKLEAAADVAFDSEPETEEPASGSEEAASNSSSAPDLAEHSSPTPGTAEATDSEGAETEEPPTYQVSDLSEPSLTDLIGSLVELKRQQLRADSPAPSTTHVASSIASPAPEPEPFDVTLPAAPQCSPVRSKVKKQRSEQGGLRERSRTAVKKEQGGENSTVLGAVMAAPPAAAADPKTAWAAQVAQYQAMAQYQAAARMAQWQQAQAAYAAQWQMAQAQAQRQYAARAAWAAQQQAPPQQARAAPQQAPHAR